MTLVSDIITRAYRESNLITINATPTTNEAAEGLALLNTLLLSTVGNEAGDGLSELNYGGTYDQSGCCSPWVRDDTRVVLNLSSAVTLYLDPHPFDGQRLAIVDAANNLATHNLTLNGNGRTIESALTTVLNTNGLIRQWLYRADLGEWVVISALGSSDALPFPAEFDDYFSIMLALRLNPRHGAELSPLSAQTLVRTRSQIRSRYSGFRQVRSDLDARNFYSSSNYGTSFGDANDNFSKGRWYPW